MAPEGQRVRLRVLVSDERGRTDAAPGLGRWLARIAPSRARGTVAVAVVSDKRIRQLNRRYRGYDYATDVLSFPAADAAGDPAPLAMNGFWLGDIVIGRGIARRQARAAGHSERTELRVLALHGLLHLIGYDHERDGGRMSHAERRLRRKGGLPEGLIERSRERADKARRSGNTAGKR
jgi:probable rRNA maturation factor